MTDEPISAFTDGSPLVPTDYVPIVRGSASYKALAAVPVQLAKTVLGSPSPTLHVTGLPSSFSILELHMLLRSDYASGQDDMLFRFNSDTGTNYELAYSYGGHSSGQGDAQGQSAISFNTTGLLCSAFDAANRFSQLRASIVNYAASANDKTVNGSGSHPRSTSDGYVWSWGGIWLSTAAINEITVSPRNGANWVTGSTLLVYGLP